MFKKHIVGDRYNVEPWKLKNNNSEGWNAKVHSELCYESKAWKSLDDRTNITL